MRRKGPGRGRRRSGGRVQLPRLARRGVQPPARSARMRLLTHQSTSGMLRRRCFAQLSLLGYILVPIFTANRWWLTLLYALFMLGVAAVEAVSRPTQTYNGMLLQVGVGA